MTFAKPATKQNDEFEYSTYCSIDGCGRLWAVRSDGEKPKCSYHQWQNSGKPRKQILPAGINETTKTVAQWYDDKDEPF